MKRMTAIRLLVALVAVSGLFLTVGSAPANGQRPLPPPSVQTPPPTATSSAAPTPSATPGTAGSAEQSAQSGEQAGQSDAKRESVGQQLVKEEREAEGEKEENANLKYSAMVGKLAKLTGLSVHGAHWLAMGLNFAIIVVVVFWFGRKSVPGMMRRRGEEIRRALESARKASEEANQRLAEIESRLEQMDAEIGKMQVSADREAAGEEERVKKSTEEEIRKVVEAAEQEIIAATKQAQRELSTHTADLAIALARKQISVDARTDQVLVRDFAAKLTAKTPQNDGGKDGR